MARIAKRLRLWGAIALMAGFALCLAGMVLGVLGEVLRNETLVSIGGSLTLPLTFFYIGLLTVILIGAIVAAALNLLQAAARLLMRLPARFSEALRHRLD